MKWFAALLFLVLLYSGYEGCSKPEKSTTNELPKSKNESDSSSVKKTVPEIKSGGEKESSSVIGSMETAAYLGKKVIVKGVVAQVFSKNNVTYLNIDRKFPVNKFFAVVFSDSQSLFPDIKKYEGRQVEIEGVLTSYKGKSEIILTDPKMIRLSDSQ